jgi:ABC-type branched-subunit amino acid transport system ATPase component
MLQLKDIFVSFHGSKVLNGISCTVAEGETVGVIGPNGSGKTTLFNCISGFVSCDSGGVELRGQEISHLAPHHRARLGLGRVFQNFGIFREMTLLENMQLALESRRDRSRGLLPWSRRTGEVKDEALRYLHEIHLEGKALHKAGSLSGGQMRLLEIARTLAVGADLILLDEPTAGVSPRMKEDIASSIKKLQSLGKTVLIIEHDITFIQKFCSRIVVLEEGRVVLDDSPERVRSDARLQEIYFGRDAGGHPA